jgi:hypothetical protein
MMAREFAFATSIFVVGVLGFIPTAAADAPGFPDLSAYQADSPTMYRHGDVADFRTPDGLLCRLQPDDNRSTFWCYGNLHSVPGGVNVVSGPDLKRWGFLPPDAHADSSVLPAMHSLTVAGRQTTITCVAGEGDLTACKSVLRYGAGGGEETGFVASPQGSRVWRNKL